MELPGRLSDRQRVQGPSTREQKDEGGTLISAQEQLQRAPAPGVSMWVT